MYFQPYFCLGSCTETSHIDRMDHIYEDMSTVDSRIAASPSSSSVAQSHFISLLSTEDSMCSILIDVFLCVAHYLKLFGHKFLGLATQPQGYMDYLNTDDDDIMYIILWKSFMEIQNGTKRYARCESQSQLHLLRLLLIKLSDISNNVSRAC